MDEYNAMTAPPPSPVPVDDAPRAVEPGRRGRTTAERRWLLVLIIALLLGAGLRIGQYLAQRSYWHDEASLVLNIFEKPAAELLGRLDSAQAAPPLFLLIQRGIYVTLGPSELALRLVPLVLGVASLGLFGMLTWRVLPADGAALAAIMFALSDRLIWHATEAKQYSGDVFVALLLLLCVVPPRHRDNGDREISAARRLLRAALLASAAVWFSHPVAFMFGGISLALLPGALRERRIGTYVAGNLLFAMSFAGLYLLSIRRQQVALLYDYWGDRFVNLSRPLKLPAWLLEQTSQLFNYPYETAGAVLLVLGVLGAWAWVTARRWELLLAIVVPIALVLLAACLHRYPYGGNRLTLFLAPGLFILAAQGILEVRNHLLPRIGHAWLAVPVFVVGVGLYHIVFRPPVRAHIRPVVHYVQEHHQAGDAIFTTKMPEFRCYWRGNGTPVHHAEAIDAAGEYDRFWLVASYTAGRRDRVLGELIARIEQHAQRRDEYHVPGGTAILFTREPSGSAAGSER
jgi:hypothetical protein